MTQNINDLMEMAGRVNGRARTRTIGKKEASEMLELVKKLQGDEKVTNIRVYSREGFVPNSYKYRAEIRGFEARRVKGKLTVCAITVDAKRSLGNGSLVTVNSRAYEG
jgi:hypothetical protein